MVKTTRRLTRKQRVNLSIKKRKTQNKRLYKNKTKHSKRYKGGIKIDKDVLDTNTLLSYYLNKRIINNTKYKDIIIKNPLIDSIDIDATTLLMVIDMQNDFLDRIMDGDRNKSHDLTGPEIPSYGKIGSFAVNNGKTIIPGVKDFVNKVLSANGKVVFSRDVHPCDHCSFMSIPSDCISDKTLTGPFPPHCIVRTPGSGFAKEIKECIEDNINSASASTYKTLGRIDDNDISVIFKGCSQNTDSFGAIEYKKDDDYAKSRQEPGCNPPDMKNTGGFYSSSPENHEILEDTYDPMNDIKDENNRFKIPENITKIYVVGLAGDYCVCDTAINIKQANPNCEVNILYDLTRNAFIPTFGIIPEDININNDSKLLQNYLFKFNGTNYTTLTEGERNELDDKRLNNSSIDPHEYWHFLTDITELFNRYAKNDVKVIITDSTLNDLPTSNIP